MSPSLQLTDRLTETAILASIRRLIECESPSDDDAAVARSADLVAEIGTELLGVAPERIVVDGCTHLRWRFGEETRVLLLAHHDTVGRWARSSGCRSGSSTGCCAALAAST